MDRESYELIENSVVPCYVIPEFHTAYGFPYYFKVYTQICIYIKVMGAGLMG